MKNITLVLASKSPRRRQLVDLLGFPVDIVTIDVDEQVDVRAVNRVCLHHDVLQFRDGFFQPRGGGRPDTQTQHQCQYQRGHHIQCRRKLNLKERGKSTPCLWH